MTKPFEVLCEVDEIQGINTRERLNTYDTLFPQRDSSEYQESLEQALRQGAEKNKVAENIATLWVDYAKNYAAARLGMLRSTSEELDGTILHRGRMSLIAEQLTNRNIYKTEIFDVVASEIASRVNEHPAILALESKAQQTSVSR